MHCDICKCYSQYTIEIHDEYAPERNSKLDICLDCFDGLENRNEKDIYEK